MVYICNFKSKNICHPTYYKFCKKDFLSKILEKVVLGQVLKHVKSNGFDEVLQSAYKMHHSTETALLKVTSDILDLEDDKNLCLLVLLDLTAAFDTIDHEILVNRLKKSFLVSGKVLTWFESYLSNRFYCVKVRNETSQNLPLKYGVPQGSVLGPVLFTMYTKPLSALIQKHSISYHLYADDTQLYGASDTENIHQLIHTTTHCIQDISSWMNMNKLKLNEDKTDIIIFGCSKSIDSLPVIKFDLNGHEVLCSKKVKNLGAILDEDMSMFSFVSNLCKNLYFQVRKISSIRKYINHNVAKTLVTTLILSRIDYCYSLLAGLPKQQLQRLQNLQNNAAKLITLKRKRDHVTPMLIELHCWLNINDRICYKICLFCFKCLNNMAPEYLTGMLRVYTPSWS